MFRSEVAEAVIPLHQRRTGHVQGAGGPATLGLTDPPPASQVIDGLVRKPLAKRRMTRKF
jgi:hypothetical protein